jgi:hypothetical protein
MSAWIYRRNGLAVNEDFKPRHAGWRIHAAAMVAEAVNVSFNGQIRFHAEVFRRNEIVPASGMNTQDEDDGGRDREANSDVVANLYEHLLAIRLILNIRIC